MNSRSLGMIAAIATVIALITGCATPPEEPSVPAAEIAVDAGWYIRPAPPEPVYELVEPFIKLVDLSRLRVGMTKDEVRAIFPDPLEIELQRDDEFWIYNFAQLIFRGDYLKDWFNM